MDRGALKHVKPSETFYKKSEHTGTYKVVCRWFTLTADCLNFIVLINGLQNVI